jgi:nucleoside-diphosphate-sugar epimerase
VRVLARAVDHMPTELRLRVDLIQGELAGPVLARSMRGVDTVFHLAACARAWSRDPAEFSDVNVGAVDRVLDCARAAGVRRVVHVSTVLTLTPSSAAGPHPEIPYIETKRQGERLVDAYVAAGGDAVVAHPTRVYGPGPLNDANGVTRLVAQYLGGPMVFRLDDDDVLANYVHVADVAAGLRLAAERGLSGAHYVLGGENSSLRGLLELVGELAGVRRRIIPLPRSAALAAAHAALLWGRLGGTAFITPDWVRAYFEDQRVDVGDTCRSLGYEYRPLATGLEETIRWLRQEYPAAS